MKFRTATRWTPPLIAALAVVGVAAATGAAQDLTYAEGPPTPPEVVVVGNEQPAAPSRTSGLMVFRDPDTGEIVTPTAERLAEFRAKLAADLSPSRGTYTKTVWPDGRIQITVIDGFEDLAIARVGADGSTSHDCVNSLDEAARLLTEPAPVTPQEPTRPVPVVK